MFFTEPAGYVDIRLITKYSPKRGNGFAGLDTIYKTIFVGDKSPLFGEYEGIHTDEPDKKIKIGWLYNSDPRINRSFFAIENLPEGFPIKSEIVPRSGRLGMVSSIIPIEQTVLYQGQWINAVYAIGILNSTKDSINIRYNYGIIKNRFINVFDWSTVVVRNFKGKNYRATNRTTWIFVGIGKSIWRNQ